MVLLDSSQRDRSNGLTQNHINIQAEMLVHQGSTIESVRERLISAPGMVGRGPDHAYGTFVLHEQAKKTQAAVANLLPLRNSIKS